MIERTDNRQQGIFGWTRGTFSRWGILLAAAGCLIPLAIYASEDSDGDGFLEFVEGTDINPDEVNGNFDHIHGLIQSAATTSPSTGIAVDENGDVGIGTTKPEYLLELEDEDEVYLVLRESASQAKLALVQQSTQSYVMSDNALNLYTGGQPRVRIDENGKVGVGTDPSGDASVSIVSADNASLQYALSLANPYGASGQQAVGLLFGNSPWSGSGKGAIAYTRAEDPYGRGDFQFLQSTVADNENATLSDAVMTIQNSGNVGIGTSSPKEKLHVSGGKVKIDGGNAFMLENSSATSSAYVWNGGDEDEDKLSFGNSINDADVVIDAFGNVGVGTSEPLHPLHVRGTGGIAVDFNGTESQSGQAEFHFLDNGNKTSQLTSNFQDGKFYLWHVDRNQLVIDSEHHVGIETDNPEYTLDVTGTVAAEEYVTTSDLRFKHDVQTLPDALGLISQLRGVNFYWNDPTKSPDLQLGLIAQEVEEVFPEVVSTDSQGYKSVAYGKLVAPLIEAVKAQQGTIETQQVQLQSQQVQLESQQTELETQKTQLEAQRARLDSQQTQLEMQRARLAELERTVRMLATR